jgi:hypothetical protein
MKNLKGLSLPLKGHFDKKVKPYIYITVIYREESIFKIVKFSNSNNHEYLTYFEIASKHVYWGLELLFYDIIEVKKIMFNCPSNYNGFCSIPPHLPEIKKREVLVKMDFNAKARFFLFFYMYFLHFLHMEASVDTSDSSAFLYSM